MAEQSLGFLSDIRSQFQNFFQGLSLGKKIFLFSSLASVLIGLGIFVYFSQQVTWSPLVSGLDQNDTARIVKKLDELQVPYHIQPGGTGILVPSNMVDRAKLEIASSGLQLGGVVGLEIFDKTELGATEFQQKVQYKRAIEGELVRLVTQIQPVKAAKISVAIPEKSLFLDQERSPTASVVVEMQGSQRLSQKYVNTIVNLVAGAIVGMEPENVRVSDQAGNLLSKGGDGLDFVESMNKNFAYQHNIEARLEQKVLTQLEKIAGQDRVEVRVSAKINFDTSEVVENLVDPDASAIVSEESTSEKSTGSRSIPVGVPGATSNSPEVRAGASEIANVADMDKKTKRTNYVNSKKQIVSKPAIGKVERISVAVLMDGKYEYVRNAEGDVVGEPVYKPWAPEELDVIAEIVKSSVGFEPTRGDTLEVKNIRFTQPLLEQEQLNVQKQEATRKFFLDAIKFVSVGLILLFIIFMVIRPMVQKLSAKPEDLDLLMGLPTTIGELEGEELEIPTEKDVGIPPRDKIIEIARQDPLKTASLIRTWLRDKK